MRKSTIDQDSRLRDRALGEYSSAESSPPTYPASNGKIYYYFNLYA